MEKKPDHSRTSVNDVTKKIISEEVRSYKIDEHPEKKALRRIFTMLRDGTNAQYRAVAAKKAYSHLMKTTFFQEASCLYVYVSMRSEFPTRPIIEACFERGLPVAVPRVSGKTMDFYIINSFDQLERGTFGVMEPNESCPKANCPEALMLIPGLSFTRRGGIRLGYGGGYYDRYLERNTSHTRIGLCFDSQLADALPEMPHDVPMQMVLTERGLAPAAI